MFITIGLPCFHFNNRISQLPKRQKCTNLRFAICLMMLFAFLVLNRTGFLNNHELEGLFRNGFTKYSHFLKVKGLFGLLIHNVQSNSESTYTKHYICIYRCAYNSFKTKRPNKKQNPKKTSKLQKLQS